MLRVTDFSRNAKETVGGTRHSAILASLQRVLRAGHPGSRSSEVVVARRNRSETQVRFPTLGLGVLPSSAKMFLLGNLRKVDGFSGWTRAERYERST